MREIVSSLREAPGTAKSQGDLRRVGLRAWFNAGTKEASVLHGRETHMDALMRHPALYGHDEDWDIVAASAAAMAAGWVRLAVEVSGPATVALAQAGTPAQALAGVRWMRARDANEWDVLRVQTDAPKSFSEIDAEGVERYVRTGRTPRPPR